MKHYVLLITLLVNFGAFAQLEIIPDNVLAECPNEWIVYTVNNSNPSGCIYDWEVTNGEIQGGYQSGGKWLFTGGNIVNIKWDYSSTSGSVRAEAFNCNGNGTVSITQPIITLQGVSPGSITGPSEVPANITTNRQYTTSQINFANRGDGDFDPFEVDAYEWQLPGGWTIVSGASNMTVTVKPDAFTQGNVRVRGVMSQCTSDPYYTTWSTPFPVTRTVAQPQAISGNGGRDFIVCGDTSPITFSVPDVDGATSYTWTKPPNWTGSSTTSSITLTPDGETPGDITVKANSGTYVSPIRSRSLGVEETDPNNPPQVSGPALFCSSSQATYTITNLPSNASVNWATSNNLSVVSTQGSSATIQSNSLNKQSWVRPTIQNACGADIQLDRYEFWVGAPAPVATQYGGHQECINLRVQPNPYVLPASPGAVSYQLQSSHFFLPPNPNPGDVIRFRTFQAGYYPVTLTTTNACGSSSLVFYVTAQICSSGYRNYSVYPNPAQSMLKVEQTNREASLGQQTKIRSHSLVPFELYDAEQNLVMEGYLSESESIDISSLSTGRYILLIHNSEKPEQHHVFIK